MEYKFLRFEKKGPVAWITMNRPAQRNALCMQLIDEMTHCFRMIEEDNSIVFAVLTGEGSSFAAGADLKELSSKNAINYMDFGGKLTDLSRLIRENSKIVIAMANGFALGGGNVILLSCDIIVAADNAKFGMSEINVGIMGGTTMLAKHLGRFRAAEYCYLGKQYTAQEAYEMGLVYKVVPADRLLDEVNELLRQMQTKSPLGLIYTKKTINAGFKYNFEIAYDFQVALQAMCFSDANQKEGMKAFLEKRPPSYAPLEEVVKLN